MTSHFASLSESVVRAMYLLSEKALAKKILFQPVSLLLIHVLFDLAPSSMSCWIALNSISGRFPPVPFFTDEMIWFLDITGENDSTLIASTDTNKNDGQRRQLDNADV